MYSSKMISRVCRLAFATLPLIIAFFAQAESAAAAQEPTKINQPLGVDIVKHLEKAAFDGLSATQSPDYTGIQSIQGPNSATKQQKSTVLYIGANFCPFCAALRWPLTIALMRFGQFSDLETMRSGSRDIYPNTPTLTFAHAKYISQYVNFTPIETSDRLGHPLDPLQGEQKKLFIKFDAEPYTSHPKGIPFLYIGGHWMLLGSPVDPALYAKLGWTQIAHKLSNPNDALTRVVMPQANLITAAICQTTHQKPTKVCGSPGVQSAASMLPPMP